MTRPENAPYKIVQAERLEAFGRLVSELCGTRQTSHVPALAGLLLFAEVVEQFFAQMAAQQIRDVLVQESLLVDVTRAVEGGEVLQVLWPPPDSFRAAETQSVEATIRSLEDDVVMLARAVFRLVPAERLAQPAPASPRQPGQSGGIRLPAFPLDAIRLYLRMVEDRNAAHDPLQAPALGLGRAVVPGALMAAVCEGLAVRETGRALRRINMRFVAPVFLGDDLVVDILDRTPAPSPESDRMLRLTLASPAGGLTAVADLTLA